MTTALDILKDNCSWEDLKPLGQCVMLIDEMGNKELAEQAAIDILKLATLVYETSKKTPEYEQCKKECQNAIDHIDAGIERMKKMAKKMGIEFNEDDFCIK